MDWNQDDIVTLRDFPLAWRLTDARRSAKPQKVLNLIQPLSLEKARELSSQSPFFKQTPHTFDCQRYHVCDQFSLAESSSESDAVYTSLQALSIDAAREVFVLWSAPAPTALVTDWQTFVEIWDDLWYPFDALSVFDGSMTWAVLLGPEEWAAYVERDPADSALENGPTRALTPALRREP